MNTKDLASITTVALGTAALTVATFLGNTIEAGNDANPATSTIARPELVADGVRMTLAPQPAASSRQEKRRRLISRRQIRWIKLQKCVFASP